MAAPEYVPRPAAEKPRVYESPPHRPGGWRQDRPSEVRRRQPSGGRLGHQGPDQGYALRLARHFDEQLVLTAGEHRDDVVAGCLGVATKRASSFGRAPVIHDLTIAFTVWGFLTEAPAELVALRRGMFESAHHIHHDKLRRAIADAVPESVLRRSPAEVEAQWRIDWSSCIEIPVERPPLRAVGSISVSPVAPAPPVAPLHDLEGTVDDVWLEPEPPTTAAVSASRADVEPADAAPGVRRTSDLGGLGVDPNETLRVDRDEVRGALAEVRAEMAAASPEAVIEPAASTPVVPVASAASTATAPVEPLSVRRTSDLGGLGVDPKETLRVDRDEVRGALAEVRAEMAAASPAEAVVDPGVASAPVAPVVSEPSTSSEPVEPLSVRRTSDLGGVGVDPKETLRVDRDEVRGALAEVRAEMAVAAAATALEPSIPVANETPDDRFAADRFAADDSPADFGMVDELERFSSPSPDSPPSQRTPVAPVPVKSSSLFSRAATPDQGDVAEAAHSAADRSDDADGLVESEAPDAPTAPTAPIETKPAPVRPIPIRKPLTYQDEEEVARLLAQARQSLRKPKN